MMTRKQARNLALLILSPYLLAFIGYAAWAFIGSTEAGPFDEERYCSIEPVRDSNGRIARSAAVVRAFRAVHPCPATGLNDGVCAGWNIDHVIPLAVGGCDSVSNLQWLPVEIKRCAGESCKDRWERKVYKRP